MILLSFFTVSKCYLFYVIIFPCTCFVLSFIDIYIMNNDNIQAFKIDNIYSMKNYNILYTWKW
jgi:hypothetical protein